MCAVNSLSGVWGKALAANAFLCIRARNSHRPMVLAFFGYFYAMLRGALQHMHSAASAPECTSYSTACIQRALRSMPGRQSPQVGGLVHVIELYNSSIGISLVHGVGWCVGVDEVVRVSAEGENDDRPDADRLPVLRQYELQGLVDGRLVGSTLARRQLARGGYSFHSSDQRMHIYAVSV